MNPISSQEALEISQTLAEKGEYEKALACIGTMKCVMGEWMKGKIYFESATQTSNTFSFKNYATEEMKCQHRETLDLAYNHLYNAALMLPSATDDIKNRLNKCLWDQIAQVQNEISKNRIIVEDDDDMDVHEDDEKYQQFIHTENLIDDITEWTF